MVNHTSIIRGRNYSTAEWIEVVVREGIIVSVDTVEALDQDDDLFIAPGLVDLQVNGFAGYDLNLSQANQSTRMESVKAVTNSLLKYGTTSFCPTIITASNQDILEAMKSIKLACSADELINDCILGVHLEGPYISKESGPRGAHPLEHTRNPDWDEFIGWQEASGNRIKIVTLAPELPGAIQFIKKLVSSGVVAALGHTAATDEQIKEAIHAGATMSTHLGNGAHGILPRHPNYIWSQLAEDHLFASVIADGHHLHDSVLKVMLRAKQEKLVIVSDAVHLAKQDPGIYETHIGGKVELLSNGRLQSFDYPMYLAGSSAALIDCVEYFCNATGEPFSQSIERASKAPAFIIDNNSIGKLEKGCKADFILYSYLQESKQITIKQIYKKGVQVH